MSAWGEMRRRGSGKLIRKEDQIEESSNGWEFDFSKPNIRWGTKEISARLTSFEKELDILKKQVHKTSTILNKFKI